MKNATHYHSRSNQNPAILQATENVPAVGRVCRLDETTKGRQRNTERQTKSSTNSDAANGFLTCTFLPKLQEATTVQACRKTKHMERDFYQSLSRLAEHYGIQPMPSSQFGFPYNIALALDDAGKQLKGNVLNWEELCLIQDSKSVYLQSGERYNTGTNLYYIPVLPLYRLSRNPKRKQTIQLLLSVCAYLYHVAGIPYYRKQGTYLYWKYEMITEWMQYDEDNEYTPAYFSEMKQAELIGDRMEKKIYNPNNLSRFKERLNAYRAKDSMEQSCYLLAQVAFDLWQQFPASTIFQNTRPNEEVEDEDLDTSVSMDRYISFCADGEGRVFDTLFESVNVELQEYGYIEEPALLKRFDGSNCSGRSLELENRLFPLIEEVIYLLNSL